MNAIDRKLAEIASVDAAKVAQLKTKLDKARLDRNTRAEWWIEQDIEKARREARGVLDRE